MLLAPTPCTKSTGALGAAVGGVGAAIGAGAAWRAAKASQATSRDALEALAVGIRPRVRIAVRQIPLRPQDPMPGPTRLAVRVVAVGEWPAADLEVDAAALDGQQMHATSEHLDGGGEFMGDHGPQWVVPLREVTADRPPKILRAPTGPSA
jgi:hypothetical protein